MPPTRKTLILRAVAASLGVLGLLAGLAAAMPLVGLPSVPEWLKGRSSQDPARQEGAPGVEAMPGRPDTLRVSSEVVVALRIQTAKAERATTLSQRRLSLSGQFGGVERGLCWVARS